MSRKKYAINLSCGQTALYPLALAEMGKQLHTPIYYLPYYELEIACIKQLQAMMHTQNDVLTLIGTATYGEEAAMVSTLERGDHVLTVNTGLFGQVLTDLARVVGAEPTEIKLPAGQSVTTEQIREALLKDPTIKMVAVVQVETSRGTVNPVDAIGYMLQREFPHVLYMVDAVSSLAAVELRVDEWGIDLCCTSSQKSVSAPQGVAIVSVSQKAWKVMEERKTPIYSLCLDLLYWRHYHRGVRQAQAHWYDEGPSDPALSRYKAVHGPSPSYVLMKALKASLDEIMEEGLENVLRRHRIAARALRAGIRAMGLQTLASEENAAPNATCVVVPGERFDVRRFMRLMWEEHGIATAGGSPSREAQGYVGFRVGTMGFVAAPTSVYAFLSALEQVLPRMGYTVKIGAALPAAQAVFAAGE